MRILITIPHFFGGSDSAENRSTQANKRDERLRALMATISGLHQALGASSYGLDHGTATAWPMTTAQPHALEVAIVTTGNSHLVDALGPLARMYRHVPTDADPKLLGFECHRLLRAARGSYDYYGYVEDDIVIVDPLFLRKRAMFDRAFGPMALLQPNRYEATPLPPVTKLYVDYRLGPHVTARYQHISDQPRLEMPFLDDRVAFERTSYPSAGCFFLNGVQLGFWADSPHFLDGDVSYLSPLDSAVTLSIMKTFRIYKPVLEQAWFLEVLHASPRWIGSVTQIARLEATPPPPLTATPLET
ncbi:hypothetical protein ACQR1I_32795 [Bradyrhizobium sp. HKCCYLS2038]|uniref:hypothetical protein n=1 Tax=unclassified Bradyrhizobium TaxID=2631580 RepID=UPI003EBB4F44